MPPEGVVLLARCIAHESLAFVLVRGMPQYGLLAYGGFEGQEDWLPSSPEGDDVQECNGQGNGSVPLTDGVAWRY